jgi:hypothetical protein
MIIIHCEKMFAAAKQWRPIALIEKTTLFTFSGFSNKWKK